MTMTGDEISERLIVGFESFLSLGISFLSKVTGYHIPPLSTPAICHLYGSDTPTTEFFLETSITSMDDVCVASDWLVLFFQFLAIHTFSWVIRWLVIEPMVRWHFSDGVRGTKKRVSKFSQATVGLLFHTLSSYFAWRILASQDWLWQSDQWSKGFEDPIIAPDLKFYYLLYAARYISDLTSRMFECPKSDTWAYAAHHAVSIALVLGSATAGYIRIGCVMMFFLDWVDPLMLTAKIFRYLSTHRRDGYQMIADRLFELFGVGFVLTRNVMLNYVIFVCLRDFPDSAVTLKACCVILGILQTYWLVVLIKTAVQKVSNDGNMDDIRSDDDENEDAQHKRIAPKKGQ